MSIVTDSVPTNAQPFNVRVRWCQGIRSKTTKRLMYEPYIPLLSRNPHDCLVGDLLLEVSATKSKCRIMEVPLKTKRGKPSMRRFMYFRCIAVLDGGFQVRPIGEDDFNDGFLSMAEMRMWIWIRES